MERDGTPRTPALTRRSFLALAAAAAGFRVAPAWAEAAAAAQGEAAPARDGDHALAVRVPRLTSNGAKVPIVVETAHPMAPDHHVTTVRVTNDGDPISSKGTFHFTPANGRVYLAFQARMHEGISEVRAAAECSRGRTFTASSPIEIPVGKGGCLAGGAPKVRARGDDVAPPVIRIAELVERGAIRRGEIVHVQLKMRHPNRTGLAFRDGRLVQESEPIHIDAIEVFYDDEPVSRFAMTSALSDDPFIGFALLARREGKVRVVVTNSRGQRFEATHELHLA